MIRSTCLALLMLLTLPAATCAEGLLAILSKGQRQEKLYYTLDALPPAVSQLIAGNQPAREYQDAYRATDDEITKFNLVLIMDKKLHQGIWTGADHDAALAFLRSCVRNANPWIKTEAVFALGNSGDPTALPDVRTCMDDASLTAVYHAVLAWRQLSGDMPELNAAQQRKVQAFSRLSGDMEAQNALADKELADFVTHAAF
ncbi:MAG: HEAT repeat domain-containing protein [Planctomycetes bacterium]|nr:HEAT repeat domain-containing protein [Planctomycetota bacterium]